MGEPSSGLRFERQTLADEDPAVGPSRLRRAVETVAEGRAPAACSHCTGTDNRALPCEESNIAGAMEPLKHSGDYGATRKFFGATRGRLDPMHHSRTPNRRLTHQKWWFCVVLTRASATGNLCPRLVPRSRSSRAARPPVGRFAERGDRTGGGHECETSAARLSGARTVQAGARSAPWPTVRGQSSSTGRRGG